MGSYDKGTSAYDYSLEPGIFNAYVASDSLMQFIGTADGAHESGSEQIYLPLSIGFRSATVFPIRDLDHLDSLPGPAVLVDTCNRSAFASIAIKAQPNPVLVILPSSDTCSGSDVEYATEAGKTNYVCTVTGEVLPREVQQPIIQQR